jgi:hypothetical protein
MIYTELKPSLKVIVFKAMKALVIAFTALSLFSEQGA